MPVYSKIDDATLQATTTVTDATQPWGSPRLHQIFNFRARQVTTVFERGALQEFTQPGYNAYSSQTGYAAALTSSMQIQNFRDIESQDEIASMHRELVRLGGTPPALEDVLPGFSKKGPMLKV